MPVPPPLPAAESRPTPPPARQQVASLPQDGETVATLPFDGDGTLLAADAEAGLRTLAGQLADGSQRLQIKAFASGEGDNASRARRTSLKRALTVRSFLIDQGIGATRIDVRALGAPRDGGAEDRVDIVVLAN